jgi:hypothetical protein
MPLQDLNTASGSTSSFRAWQGPYASGHALSQNRSTPTVPTGQRGQGSAYNVLLVDRLSVECAGYGATAALRGRVWEASGGAAVARSASQSVAGTTAVDVSLQNFDLESPVILDGGTLYRWGVYSSSVALAVQRQVNSSFNVYQDTSIGANDSWSTGNSLIHPEGSGSSLVGTFRYYLIPTAPSVSSGGASTSSISFSWSVSDNGGKTISSYDVQYKPSYNGTWETYDSYYTSTSVTISGLASSTTYDVRVAAKNQVSDLAGTTSEFGYTSVTTDAATPTFSFSPAPATTTVPDLTGLTLTQANTALSNANLNSSSTAQSTGATSVNNNLVISGTQSPGGGSVVNVGSTVSFQYYSYTPPAQEVSVWNGTSWVASSPKIWNGTSWVDPAVIRVWNGTSWVNPT